MSEPEATVFVVDDDESLRRSLARLIRSHGWHVEALASATAYLERPPTDGPACLVLDVRLPDLNGLELQRQLERRGQLIPIVFITGHGDVPMSVRAMKDGAVDFLPKPFEAADLIGAVEEALALDRRQRQEQGELTEVRERFDLLTPRERQVFGLVVTGMLNKQVADELGTSEKTVKVHRAHLMQKMQARSVAGLVKMSEMLRRGNDRSRPTGSRPAAAADQQSRRPAPR